LKVGIERKGFAGKAGFFRLDDFADIVRKYLGRHTDSDSLRSDEQHNRQLGAEYDRFLIPAVIRRNIARNVRIKKDIFCKFGDTAFDIPRCGGFVSRKEVTEVALLIDKEAFIG